jgi:hypothetical protein
MYRVWCEVCGGVTGSRADWIKDVDGVPTQFSSKEEAHQMVAGLAALSSRPGVSFRCTVKEPVPYMASWREVGAC